MLRSLVLLVALAVVIASCGGSAATSPTATAPAATALPSAAPAQSDQPELTPVPGGESLTPPPLPSDVTTTDTGWGTILDVVPTTFPVFPGAEPADSPDAPVSAAYLVTAAVDEVATWYRGALEGEGYQTMGLSDELEDGSRVLDSQADIPECRIQTTFRPAGESTMISVLFAAGCAGGEG